MSTAVRSLRSFRFGLPETRAVAAIVDTVLLLNTIGWGVLLLVVAPHRLTTGGGSLFDAGLGLSAFLLGARHAFDADHITAIDNTTRKLVGEGRAALSGGLWFSLGHSTVVFALFLLLAIGLRTVAAPLIGSGGGAQPILVLGSAVVAASFLLLIGLINLGALRGLLSVARSTRNGTLDEAQLERHLHERGFLARLLRGILGRVREPRHIYPVGLLMGLGFDTASQVALLVLAGGTAAGGVPWYAVLVLPVLFAAGMTLFDGADGILMARAYRWAFLTPHRRIRYNIVVTAVSVVAALTVAIVVLLVATAQALGAVPALNWVSRLDLQQLGAILVATFAGIWGLTVAASRLRSRRRRRSAASRARPAAALPEAGGPFE